MNQATFPLRRASRFSTPRPSDLVPPATPRWAKFWLNAFLVIGWLVTVSRFIGTQISESLGARGGLLGLLIYPVCLGLAVYCYERIPGPKAPLHRNYLCFFVVLLALLALYGFRLGNAPRIIAFDLISYVTVLGAFILGRHDAVWRDARPVITVLSGLSVILAIIYTDSAVLTDRSILNDQSGSQFETALALAPLFAIFTAASERRDRWYLPLLLITGGCLLVYLYFGRRGISVRCALELLTAAVILPSMLRRHGRVTLVVSGFALFIGAIVAYFPFAVLIERFQGQYGVTSTVLLENERWAEVRDMASELSGVEWVFGRGMGGSFLTNQVQSLAMDTLVGDEFGRTSTHAGAALPILKGGLILLVVFFLPLVRVVGRLPRWRQLDPITLAAASAGLLLLCFQLIEGTITYSTPWAGFGIGLIMSRAQCISSRPISYVRPIR